MQKITRREFCRWCIASGVTLAVSPVIMDVLKDIAWAKPESGDKGYITTKEAMFYEKLTKSKIQCHLCPRNCVLKDGMRGFCRAREPRNGIHKSLVYGNPTAIHTDPIEKKPLFHFLPATSVFSIATAGCNYRCKYCQNWQIAQVPPEDTVNYRLPPKKVVNQAIKQKCPTIAYTYTEPSIFYEYMYDTAKIAKTKGIKNIYHSNGSLNPEPVEELCKYLDGANIDLKGFTQEFYSKIPAGDLDTVLNTIKILKKNKIHTEITNLIVPSFNDNMEVIRKMCKWLKNELGKDIPVHFSRFYPSYKLKNLPPTPINTLEKAREIALEEGLLYVYIGNVPGHKGESTYCPNCGKRIIHRVGFQVLTESIENGKCGYCGHKIPGIWKSKKGNVLENKSPKTSKFFKDDYKRIKESVLLG